ncbi:MAG: LOG family protein [Anaerolineae bacterium]
MAYVISVFGANAPLPGSAEYEAARDLGRRLAKLGMVVQTGGYGGVMEAASRGASESGGHVIGVTCALFESSWALRPNHWVQTEIKQPTLRARVVYLIEQCDGIVVMPGGIGTLSELALAWSLMQVGEIRRKPLIAVGGQWQRTLAAFVNPDYIATKDLALITLVRTPVEAVRSLQQQLASTVLIP